MPHSHPDTPLLAIVALAFSLLLLAGSIALFAPGTSSKLRGAVATAKLPNSPGAIAIVIACLMGLGMAALVYSRQFVFGSRSGNWFYEYHPQTSVPPWIPIVVLLLLAATAYVGSRSISSHEGATLFGCLLVAILIQVLIHDIYRIPLEALVRSDGANGFYSTAMRYSPVEMLTQYQVLNPSLPMHANGNMPGKTLLFQLLMLFTSSPETMGYALIALSNLGALLIYGVCRRLFHNRLAAFYAFMLYALIPARLFFLPILNTVTPVFMLLCLYLFLVFIDRKHIVWLWLLGCALFMMVLFEPSPLTTGMLFIAILLVAVKEKRLSGKDVGRLFLHPTLAFACLSLAFFVLFAFDLVGALRTVLTNAGHFNLEENRGYWQWVGANTKEFFYAAGTPIIIIFVYWVAWILWRWRTGAARWSTDTAVIVGLLGTFAAVLLLGINRGETSRLWIYLAALFPIPASLLIARTPRSPLLFFFVESTLVVQTIVALQGVAFVLPYDCQYPNTPGFEVKQDALATFWTKLEACTSKESAIGQLPQCLGMTRTGRPLGTTFEPYLSLKSIAISGGAEVDNETIFRAGEDVGVTIYWTTLNDSRRMKFSQRLQDSSGRQWMLGDYWPLDGEVVCKPIESPRRGETRADRQSFRLPPDLPPGEYEISLVIYDPETGDVMRAGEEPSARLAEINVIGAAPPPDPSSLVIPVRFDAPLSEQLAVIGYGVEPDPLRPESDGMLRVWWTALRPLTQPHQVLFELVGSDGQTVSRWLQPLSAAPPHTWQEGQIVGERYPIALDLGVASGDYRLRVTLVTPGDNSSGRSVELGAVTVQARPRTYDMPAVEHLKDMELGKEIALRGYDLEQTTGEAAELRLTLYWQALQRVTGRYKVFVHVVDDTGAIIAQRDDDPAAGTAPTQTWLAGEFVTDTHRIKVPDRGSYRLLIGLYDPETGQRLPVWDTVERRLIPDAAVPLERVKVP